MLVLVMVSVTLAVSYALLRTQGTTRLIRYNADLEAEAHQASLTGLSVAIQKMHRDPNGWVGADGSFSQTLGSTQGFDITYQTGDASLGDTHIEYPYRVTVVSTGWARDPGNASRIVRHRAGAVVRLVPRHVVKPPNNGWNDTVQSTSYRLYPRGKEYQVETVSNTMVSKTASPTTNPLGLFRTTSTTYLNGNVTVRGTLIAAGNHSDITVSGSNNTVTPSGLLPAEASSGVPVYSQPPYATVPTPGEIRVRLPSLVTEDDFEMLSGSYLNVAGMILAKDVFRIDFSNLSKIPRLKITGSPAPKNINVSLGWWDDKYWDKTDSNWINQYRQEDPLWTTGRTYWPTWFQNDSPPLDLALWLWLMPESDSSPARYHWYIVKDTDGDGVGEPLFVPDDKNNDEDPADTLPSPYDSEPAGLRWDVLRWRDHLADQELP